MWNDVMGIEEAARASVLARLWGAFAREPLDGISARRTVGDELRLALDDGRAVCGPARAAEAFAHVDDLTVSLDGEPITDPASLLRGVIPAGPTRDRLAAELDNSVENLTLARSAPPPAEAIQLDDLAGRPDALAYLEQSIIDGHPLHPLCRTRIGLSRDDVRRFAPEFRAVVDLVLVDVPPDRWLSTGAGLPPRLAMHPWQARRLRDLDAGLRPSGQRIRARPLMSLRTLALIDQPRWHLKTAVDVQMTSAVRTVSPAAVRNGPLMSTLLRRLLRDEPIDILDEVAGGAVLLDGAPSRSLAVIRRRAPALAPDEIAVPFAALSAPSPASGRSFLSEAAGGDPAGFVGRLLTLAIPPLMRLLARGVALEAHGQNTLVVLKNREPVRIIYRDMGGVRVSARRLAAAGLEAPPLGGDLLTDDPDALAAKLAASLLATVVAELLATLRRESGIDPAPLWRHAAAILRDAPDTPTCRADAATMIGATLPLKATTAMRLSARPLDDIWTRVANPMAGL
jgi:siderophore synthetase component